MGHIIAILLSFSLLSPDLIDLNSADEWSLQTLPGIGPAKAAAIVLYRDTYGGFLTLDDLEFVSGIGPGTIDGISELVTLGYSDGAMSDTSHWMPVSDSISPLLKVSILDVGQGDAILLEAVEGETWLFDGGPDTGGPLEPAVVHRLTELGVDTIDVLAFSHPHADHIGGLAAVVRRFTVLEVLDPGMIHTSYFYEDLLEEALASGCDYTIMHEQMVRSLSGSVTVEVVSLGEQGADLDLNESSALLMVSCGEFSILLTGDMEEGAQRGLAAEALPVTVLKVPHHGSISSIFPPYLRRLRPQLAVISCGRNNPFGHPHPHVLEAYAELGGEILRTDTGGTIVVETDGSRISLPGGSFPADKHGLQQRYARK